MISILQRFRRPAQPDPLESRTLLDVVHRTADVFIALPRSELQDVAELIDCARMTQERTLAGSYLADADRILRRHLP